MEILGESLVLPKKSEYRERAEECVLLAQAVGSQAQRTMLLHIAETWLRLARSEVDDPQSKERPRVVH